MRTFLSYARDDAQAEVDLLRGYLSNARRMTWVDRQNLEGGADWREKVRDAITQADAFILLLTPKSVLSDNVREEYEIALALKKHFIPILIKDCQVPPHLKTLNYRELTGAKYTDGFSKLIGDLESIWDHVSRDLADLTLGRPVHADLTTVVQELRTYTNSNVRPPEVFFAFSSLLTNITTAAAARPLHEVLHELLEAKSFVKDQWPYYQAFAANRPFFEQILTPLYTKLSPALTGVPVPIVMVVMNRAEALELDDGTAFQKSWPEVKQQFDQFKQILNQQRPGNWVDYYGVKPEDWEPFPGASNMGQIIRDELKQITVQGKPLTPKFVEARSLNDPKLRDHLRDLRYKGCLVVMDIVSMCHPVLHEAYFRSMLYAQQKVVLLQLSPFGYIPPLPDVTLTLKKRLDLEFWDRYKLDKDNNCKQVRDEIEFGRFVSNDLKALLAPGERLTEGPLSYVAK